MRLIELVSYVRELPSIPDAPKSIRPHELLINDPDALRIERSQASDAARIERSQAPSWITERAGIERIRDRGDLVLQVEQEVQPSALPADLRVPDAPIDTLAYYLPFHFPASDWGIYVRESGVLFVASILKGTTLSSGDSGLMDLGRKLLMAHEFMHFQAEVACARAEVIAKHQLYGSYYGEGLAAAHEEAIANAFAFRGLRGEPPAMQGRVTTWMRRQGPGYRDFEEWVGPKKFRTGCRLASQYILRRIPGSRTSHSEPAEFLFDAIGRFKPPTYLVMDVSLATTLKPFRKAHGMRVLVHTREHPPAHIHIEIPPGNPFTRYKWPELRPLDGDRELSSRESKNLQEYVREEGTEIDAKVRAVFALVAPFGGPPPSTA